MRSFPSPADRLAHAVEADLPLAHAKEEKADPAKVARAISLLSSRLATRTQLVVLHGDQMKETFTDDQVRRLYEKAVKAAGGYADQVEDGIMRGAMALIDPSHKIDPDGLYGGGDAPLYQAAGPKDVEEFLRLAREKIKEVLLRTRGARARSLQGAQ